MAFCVPNTKFALKTWNLFLLSLGRICIGFMERHNTVLLKTDNEPAEI
jgi:hypothetical protein